ncbi:unnamed protein product [Allacma fusca]|uniref:Lipase n=1 Tax=Allacma fusca TaxID=39272 RepID=A0A8J2KSV2_9HEXA|nr:unnamed protein product [Allacma fusca]
MKHCSHYLLIILILSNLQNTQVNGLIITTINIGLKWLGHLLSPPRIFPQDRDESALPDAIIRHNGYPAEVHQVETPDGHILPIYRIPHGKNRTSTKEPVLLMPGIITSATFYFSLSPEKALPFVLSNAGYDVWIGNYRGCDATGHKYYSKKELKYWHFGVDEIVRYDFPSIVDYILKTTNNSAISYVGHSLGTTMFFMALASQPGYNQKFRKMAGMAPGCYASHGKSMLQYMPLINLRQFVTIMDILFFGETPASRMREPLSTSMAFCRLIGIPKTCFGTLLKGFDISRINMTVIQRVLKHLPAPISARSLAQLGQMIGSDRCQMYDFGREGNMRRYGTTSPRLYYLKNITVPCMGMYGLRDDVIPPVDAKRTIQELGNRKSFTYQVKRKDFTHSDFMVDDEAKILVYDKIVEYFDSV